METNSKTPIKYGVAIGNGRVHLEGAQRILQQAHWIVAADGGGRYWRELPRLDLLIGDFDSLEKKVLREIQEKQIPIEKHPKEKDWTDGELAIDWLTTKGAEHIDLYGYLGDRWDHSLAAIELLGKYESIGVHLVLHDKETTIERLKNYHRLENRDQTVSIIPIAGKDVRLDLQGFYYPLNQEYISYGSGKGVSNLINAKYGKIQKLEGEALLIQGHSR